MQITLYQAAEAVREALDSFDPESGELPDMEAARAIVEHKGASVAAYVLDQTAAVDVLKAHAKHFADKAKTIERRVTWLRTYLAENMASTGIMSIKDERNQFTVKLEPGRDESVDVFDDKQLPDAYLREIPAKYEPDKTLIKKAIKDGFDVPGARIVSKDRLTIK